MDLSYLHLNTTNRSLFAPKICPSSESHLSGNYARLGLLRGEGGGILQVRISKSRRSGYRSMTVRSMGKKNRENSSSGGSDQPIPEGEDPEGSNPAFDSTKSEDHTPHKFHPSISDWRDFRANLVRNEPLQLFDVDAPVQDLSHKPPEPLGLKWAHPIPMPETGCVLVATEKLDGVRTFERTVVLLLRSGTKDPREGPFGVVINRPIHKKIKYMKPSNVDLATTFADCSLHFGGPLDASMFLLKKRDQTLLLPAFEQVIPGLCFGARNSLDEAASLVKKGILSPQDFRFFVGYAGWQFDQLREEIESEYWFVAACSANLITDGPPDSSSGLWEEILQLMGGSYSEISRKPKQDSS